MYTFIEIESWFTNSSEQKGKDGKQPAEENSFVGMSRLLISGQRKGLTTEQFVHLRELFRQSRY